MKIVSDSPLILEQAEALGLTGFLLGSEEELQEIKSASLALVVGHDLEGYDLCSYEYSFSFDPKDPQSLARLLGQLKKISLLEEEQNKEEERLQPYLRLLREASKYLQAANQDEKKHLMEVGKDFYHKFLPLLSLENSDHLLESVKSFPQLKDFIKALYFHRGDQLPLLKEGDILLPLSAEEGFYLYCELTDKKLKGEGAVVVSLLFHFVQDFLKLNGEIKILSSEEDAPWEEVLSKCEAPYVLLGTDGTLLLHHQDFSRLGVTPRECLQMKDGDNVEKQGQIFSIRSKNLGDKLLVIFRTEKKKSSSNLSNRELGVVSSSIAHELNNPLAGMLAAISLLFLEDLTEEEHKALTDMKVSIERCKGLVEIFLGFSRMSPHQHKVGSLTQSFTQAMNLLRFRMVESNVRLQIETQNLDLFDAKFNPSIMAMFFYIVLNELLTLGQKNVLLMDTARAKGLSLSGIIQARGDQIELQLEQKMALESLGTSRLLSHLADLLEMKLELTPSKLLARRLSH